MTLAEAFYRIAKLLTENDIKKVDNYLIINDRQYQNETIELALKSSKEEIQQLAQKLSVFTRNNSEEFKLSQTINLAEKKASINESNTNKRTAVQDSTPKKTNFFRNITLASLIMVLLAGGYYFVGGMEFIQLEKFSANASTKVFEAPERVSIADVQTILRLHGSNTIGENLAPKLLSAFLKQKQAYSVQLISGNVDVEKNIQAVLPSDEQAISIEIHAHGSSTGFRDLLAGKTDMSMSSRKIKPKEARQLEAKYGDLAASGNEHIIGVDGLAVIVHPSNPINSLNSKQIAMLFSGEYSDWAEVGGNPGRVKIFARDSNSGTWDSFKNMVLKKYDVILSASAERYESSSELSNLVSNNINAIGFIGLPYVMQSKALAVSDSNETIAIMPTAFTVATEDYPLSRRLYLYTPEVSNNPVIREFVNFALSQQGQEIVKEVGFISQNIYSVKPSVDSAAPQQFKTLVDQAERLSLALRFRAGKFELDNKGKRDMKRLLSYLQDNPEKQLMLLGFTDSLGDRPTNHALSAKRAQVISGLLVSNGIFPKSVTGFGEAMPVATNDTEFGRNKNRRVEVWVF